MSDNNNSNQYSAQPPPYETAVNTPSTIGESKFGPYPAVPNTANFVQPPTNPTFSGGVKSQTSGMTQAIPVVVSVPAFGPQSCSMICPNCHKSILTETSSHAGLLAYILCGVLFVFGCVAGCCLIPLCMSDCQDVDHICPNCKALLGSYKRL